MTTFVDTSAWLALLDRRDNHHIAAVQASVRIARAGEPWATGWHCLYEFADGMADEFGQAAAAARLDEVLATPRLVVHSSEGHVAAARQLLAGRAGWNVDFTDCLSFVMMRDHGIRRAFTFDSDFKKAGFEVVQ